MFVLPEMKKRKGVYTRKGTSTDTQEIQEHYRKKVIKILRDDRYHYTCLRRKPSLQKLFEKEFYSVADIGGGHPKLSTLVNVSQITVFDQMAEMYEESLDVFLTLYPTEAEIKFENKKITHPNFSPNAEVAVFCHILEHLEVKEIKRLLKNIEVNKILVYGPNIDAAKNENWLHFRPKDHITFPTIEGMCELIKEAGYEITIAEAYQEDMIIYAEA